MLKIVSKIILSLPSFEILHSALGIRHLGSIKIVQCTKRPARGGQAGKPEIRKPHRHIGSFLCAYVVFSRPLLHSFYNRKSSKSLVSSSKALFVVKRDWYDSRIPTFYSKFSRSAFDIKKEYQVASIKYQDCTKYQVTCLYRK